jgi:hypothetical protein
MNKFLQQCYDYKPADLIAPIAFLSHNNLDFSSWPKWFFFCFFREKIYFLLGLVLLFLSLSASFG